MTLKRNLLALVSSLFLASVAFAAPSISGPHVTMQTDGTLSDGQANIITKNAGRIQFFTNNNLCGYFDESTCALTGVTIGTVTLNNPTVSGNLTFSTAAAKIIPGATSLTIRNNADSASNIAITDAGVVTLRDDLINSTSGKGLITGIAAKPADVTAAVGNTPLFSFIPTGIDLAAYVKGSVNTQAPSFNFLKSRAVDGSADTIVAVGDKLFQFNFYGANGATYDLGGQIIASVSTTPGTTDMGTKLDFLLSPDGSATPASVLSLDQDKSALFTGTIRSSATGSVGWTPVAAADQACNTTCTSACGAGFNLTAGNITGSLLACTDATADVCLCLGAS